MDVLDRFRHERCSAILRTQHAGAVVPAMQAAIDGGFRIVEITLNTPGALDAIAHFAARPDLLVGVGTVLNVAEARAAIDAGARFVVSPVFDADVVAYCCEHSIVSVPGCATPTEMLTASRAGAPIVKLFPAPPDGPAFVRACLGPLPFLKIFPTSGANADNAAAYLAAGAFGLGFVQCLFDPDELARADFDAVRARAERLVAAVRAAPRAGDRVHPPQP